MMNMKIFAFLILDLITVVLTLENTTNFVSNELEDLSSTKVLSRRKRFIMFPDGSSFQLVFCTQTHGYLQVGDIVWFGNTAALAWELPSDPEIFDAFREKKKGYEGNRRHDVSKHIYYLDEEGRVLSKVPYKKRPIVNPAFAKRSVDNLKPKELSTMCVKEMHEKQKNVIVFNGLNENRIQYHRENRKDLYEKLETFLQGLGWNGRECVLRMLCETGKGRSEQGTFLEEIVRATFTLPMNTEFKDANSKYDEAHGSTGDCAKLYPECSNLYIQ